MRYGEGWYMITIEETQDPIRSGHDAQTIVDRKPINGEPDEDLRLLMSVINEVRESVSK